ncbi:MAG: diguanylate cyclase [Solirubrobacteraceae bacterium]
MTSVRSMYLEEPEKSLALALIYEKLAARSGDQATVARSLALQGQIALRAGDVEGGLRLAADAERVIAGVDDTLAAVEVVALRSSASFFTAAYAQAVASAERSIRLADRTGDRALMIYARRTAFLVLGTLLVKDIRERLQQLLELTVAAGDYWEQAIAHNDIAAHLEETGDPEGARAQIQRALEVVQHAHPNRFALAVIHSTAADVELRLENPAAALQHAELSIEMLSGFRQPSPYVLGSTVRAQVHAQVALGHWEDAREAGEQALAQLGDRLPRTRSLVLVALATALRRAGKLEQAYEALERSVELERQGATEISELLVRLEQAKLAESMARSESEELAEKNRQLAEAHDELEVRTRQLEALQEQLRDQAERDWLTGVHNRRYLARELSQSAAERLGPVFSVAALDLDHFKLINDRYGHAAGDQVLIGIASLLSNLSRASDIVVRSGGEEFLMVMPATSESAAVACCQRVCDAVHDALWDEVAPGLALTTSIGVASTDHGAAFETVARLADRLLYAAKQAGRDRVMGGNDRRTAFDQVSPQVHGSGETTGLSTFMPGA